MPKSVRVGLSKANFTISLIANDARWKGLRPTVKRGVEAAIALEAVVSGGATSVVIPLSLRERLGEGALKLNASLSTPLALTLSHKGRGNAQCDTSMRLSITVLLTNDAKVKALNAQYRGKNKPTNVLSFSDGSEEIGAGGQTIKHLGDIAMAYETIAREAVEQGKALKQHLSHLAIHGTLHLLGFDHESDAEAEAMEALEITILARMGIANPYEEA